MWIKIHAVIMMGIVAARREDTVYYFCRYLQKGAVKNHSLWSFFSRFKSWLHNERYHLCSLVNPFEFFELSETRSPLSIIWKFEV